jgi:hypothetical protein
VKIKDRKQKDLAAQWPRVFSKYIISLL